jgi:DNA-binding protein HU-beta
MSDNAETQDRIYKRLDLVESVIQKTGLPRGKAVIVVDTIFESITETLKSGREIRLVGFGSFVVAERKATKGHDPRTGAEIDIPEGRSVRFRPGKGLREAIALPQEEAGHQGG